MKKELKNLINETLKNLDLPKSDFNIEYPADFKFGDFSTNVAMTLSKEVNENPQVLAQKIVDKINENLPETIKKAEVAGPGFINFYASDSFFQNFIKYINNQDHNFGKNDTLKGKDIIVDHTDPNPFKEFHIGHLMSNSIGEFICRIYESSGANVTRYCYQGDVGPHVAKTVWAMRKMREKFPEDQDPLKFKVEFLGQAYVFGANAYKDDAIAKAEIDELNKRIYALFDENKENDDLDLKVYYDKGKNWSLLKFDEIYKKLNVNFKRSIFETEVFKKGEEVVRENVPDIFELSDGAIIYRGEQDGLHTRVFINSLGLPTYESKELGLVFLKNKIHPNYDLSIVITASEQKEYFKVVKSALSKINPELAKKQINICHGMMRFADGKMSSRLGNTITGESLIKSIEENIQEKISDRALSNEKETRETIAIGAIKYSILKQSTDKDIIFDFEKATSFEGDSGPYIQYAYTRAKSILEKAKEAKIKFSESSMPLDWQVTELEKTLHRFEDVVYKSMVELAPQHISTFLINLASSFNSFYTETKILEEGSSRAYKLSLTRAVMVTLKNGLHILGIKVPEKM